MRQVEAGHRRRGDMSCNICSLKIEGNLAYLASVQIVTHYKPQPQCYLKYGLQQMTEQYPQFVKVIISGNLELLFY